MTDYAPVDLASEDQVSFTLNGRTVSAPRGTMLVDACAAHDVEVPIFCYEPRLGGPIGACRMCLVRIEGMRGLITACSTPVAGDMVVDTVSAEVEEAQDGILELLLENHPLDCPVCDKGGECPLQDRTFRFGPGRSRMIEQKRHFPKPLDLSDRIALDRERCISCFRCVRFSQDVAQDGGLIFQERGGRSEITTFTGDEYEGRFTGNVIDICPVGALTSIPYRFVSRPWEIENAPSVCGHCPVGCNQELSVREGQIRRVTGRPDPNWEVEEGWLCDKGRWAHAADRSPTRITEPLLRDQRGERAVALDDAIEAAVLLLARADTRTILVGEAATVEEGFIAQELAHDAMPGARVARLGAAGGGLGPLRALPGAQLADIDRADLIAIVGGDPANQQPIVELRVRKAARRGARVIVLGARAHALEELGEAVRTAAGELARGLGRLHPLVREAIRPVVLWDELDLAAEPAASAALARALGAHAQALQLELGSAVNGAGLRALGLESAGRLLGAPLGAVLSVHADPELGPGVLRWAEAMDAADPVIAIATHGSPVTARASVVLPALSHYEREGVLVSMNGRAQRLRRGARGPEHAAPAWEILIALAHRLGTPPAYHSPRSAFAAAAAARPALAGLTYATIGETGAPLAPPASGEPAAAAPGREGEGLDLVTTASIFGDRWSHRSDALAGARTDPELTLNPRDAAAAGVVDGGSARVRSPHGQLLLTLRVDGRVTKGVAQAAGTAPGAGVEVLLPPDRAPVRVTVTPA